MLPYRKHAEKQATLAFLLSKAFKEVVGDRFLVIEHSFGDGYFCHDAHGETFTPEEIQMLQETMESYIHNNEPIVFATKSKSDILEHFYATNSHSKQEIVSMWDADPIPIVRFGDFWDLRLEPMTTQKTDLKPFEIRPYNDGFLLRFSTLRHSDELADFVDHPKLFATIEDHEQWGSILGISTIRELNEIVRDGDIKELMWVAEGLHEKHISDIADTLADGFPQQRIVSIAGPSSSGKTTFAMRLRIQLRVLGFQTQQISMDDYFINRDKIPEDETGQRDFEAFSALNSSLLCERLGDLISGRSIPIRHFDFSTGKGMDTNNSLQLGEWDFVILEGIHGLNPHLFREVGKDRVQRIYISAITQMNIDAQHRISTSDNRLLRRLVRDHRFRGYSPRETLDRWPSVRLGEEKNIFPFQDEADLMFNSSLVYELPVLAGYARPLLKNVGGSDILKDKADQLELLLSFFEPVEEEAVPGTSILREFIGKSGFDY